MSQFTAAVIGTGGIAKAHALYYTGNDRVDLVAGCDINADRLNTYCDTHGITRRYSDYQTMLAEVQPDIVSVCTWNPTHMELAIAAIESGAKAVISEKPMSDELGGPMDAVALAEERGCHFVVHHQTRFCAGYNAAREMVAAGAIGRPVSIHWHSGGGMLNMASHLIDAFRWILGNPDWTDVLGWIQRDTNRFERGSYAEEKTHALIRFGEDEMILSMDLEDGVKYKEFRLTGPDGIINFNREQAVLVNSEGAHEPQASPQPNGYLAELLAWMDGGPVHRNVASQALVTQQIMMAIYESARTRSMVTPPFEKRESPLEEMILAGELPYEGEPYDCRIPAALEYALEQRDVSP